MFGDDQNLKDTRKDLVKDTLSVTVPYKKKDLISNSYPKLNKLITALYIVTDIMDKEEPIRLKLRTFGAEILSDINSASRTETAEKIKIILSFLDIALAISLISEMNFNILKTEFTELSNSLQIPQESNQINHGWLEEFLGDSTKNLPRPTALLRKETENPNPNILKKQRRDEIIEAIKASGESATIGDVKMHASGALATCGEKTLQRELISMVKDGLLHKTGEKRWSRYRLISPTFSEVS